MFSWDFTYSEFSLFWWLRVPLGTSFWWLLEVLGSNFSDFWGVGNSLKFHWFSGPPKFESPHLVEGKLVHQGVQYNSINTSLLTCKPVNTRLETCKHQTGDWRPVRYRFDKNTCDLLLEETSDLWLKTSFLPAWWPLLKQGPADIYIYITYMYLYTNYFFTARSNHPQMTP